MTSQLFAVRLVSTVKTGRKINAIQALVNNYNFNRIIITELFILNFGSSKLRPYRLDISIKLFYRFDTSIELNEL